MESRRDQQPNQPEVGPGVGPSLARTVAAVGTVPAFIFGAAIEGIVGASLGLIVWGMLCALAAAGNRLRVRRGWGAASSATASATSPATSTTCDAALFEQLRRAPCAVCGAPTLLDACLDCSEGWSHPDRHRRNDTAHLDEPDDPTR